MRRLGLLALLLASCAPRVEVDLNPRPTDRSVIIVAKLGDETRIYAQNLDSTEELLSDAFEGDPRITVLYYPEALKQYGLQPGLVQLVEDADNGLVLPQTDYVQTGDWDGVSAAAETPPDVATLRVAHPFCFEAKFADEPALGYSSYALSNGHSLVQYHGELFVTDNRRLGLPLAEAYGRLGASAGVALYLTASDRITGFTVESDGDDHAVSMVSEFEVASLGFAEDIRASDGQDGYLITTKQVISRIYRGDGGASYSRSRHETEYERIFASEPNCYAQLDLERLQVDPFEDVPVDSDTVEVLCGDELWISVHPSSFGSPIVELHQDIRGDTRAYLTDGRVMLYEARDTWTLEFTLPDNEVGSVVPFVGGAHYVSGQSKLQTYIRDRGVCRSLALPVVSRKWIGATFGSQLYLSGRGYSGFVEPSGEQ